MDNKTENLGPEITCQELLYRVALRKGHITPDGRVQADLFMLRSDDEGCLSVFRTALADLVVVEGQFKKTRGTVTLHTGRVRDSSTILKRTIDVIPDELPDVPGHAVIIGLPNPEREYADAEFAASVLRDQCRLIILR